jgi:hypothetical protein
MNRSTPKGSTTSGSWQPQPPLYTNEDARTPGSFVVIGTAVEIPDDDAAKKHVPVHEQVKGYSGRISFTPLPGCSRIYRFSECVAPHSLQKHDCRLVPYLSYRWLRTTMDADVSMAPSLADLVQDFSTQSGLKKVGADTL